jgi:tRNA pseudouridine55 synthase
MGNASDGILLIDKDEGETSFGVVRKVRKVFELKKAGHAGTLDPFATGLLVVLLGQGTKLSTYLMSAEKRYRATVRLGVETDTLDPTGRVIQTMPVPDFGAEYIREKAEGLIGEIEQIPPMFSAIRYRGTRAYVLARKGIPVELQKRRVKVLHLEVVSIELPYLTLVLECTKGAYVRALAAELGTRLGTCGHLRSLRRLSSGPFKVGDAVTLDWLASQDRAIRDRVIPLRHALPHIQEAEVNDLTARKIRNGIQRDWDAITPLSGLTDSFEGYVKLVNGAELVAILRVGRASGPAEERFELMRVFT